ncbi:hypothetical protein F955_02522 [Acinetobacter schindleri CIP 107287]|uniref:Uncharacterized protein n=3 Tax=Acinetobacter schindleri TaxID=108981 RepID=N9AH97_9GAMM|nr:hypothetical protein F955_02522 [Acinetobacter schindleri CIP 107287]
MMMNPFFEIKYLELKWYDQETLTKVTESLLALDMEYEEQRQLFQIETTIYPKMVGISKGVLAVRFLDQHMDQPYIEITNGEKKYLSSIQDPETGFTWWIVKEQWIKEQNQWSSTTHNSVGTLRLILRGEVCEVAINGCDFTLEQLEQYLRSFKNDLWELILDDNNVVQASKEGEGIGFGEEVIACIDKLVDHAEKVLNNPKVELREVQSLKPRKSVKPVNRTFMELATKTNQRFLTSRATEPSYNVAENRYVLFALERCYRIIKQIVILAENKKQRLQHTMEKLKTQHDAFQDYVKVDRALFVSEFRKIEKRTSLEYWKVQLSQKIIESGVQFCSDPYKDVYFKLENTTTNFSNNESDGFFTYVWDGNNWIKPENKSGILKFHKKFSNLVHCFRSGMVLRMNGKYTYNTTPKSVQFYFNDIHSIELLECPETHKALENYEKEKNKGIVLGANDWLKPLSKKELDEQEKEKTALRNRIQYYTKNQELCAYVFEKVQPKFRLLKEIIQKFKRLGIKASSYFPNSMTFVQNQNYQGIHNHYKALRDITHLHDENLLISLEEIEEIGLVNMPLLYERWTLLQIILVLKGVFRFSLQENWKYKVIEAIKGNQEEISIHLSNDHAKRYITLWYEKKLPNHKRPDFILDLTWFNQNDYNFERPQYKRFVLDAKFYDKITFIKAGGMMSKIDELYEQKNYSEDGNNPVFLIHPCQNLIDTQRTAQIWGQSKT